MYYHSSSAFDNPTIIPEQVGQFDLSNNSKNNWGFTILITGLFLATGILIGNAMKRKNWKIFKNNEPNKNHETAG